MVDSSKEHNPFERWRPQSVDIELGELTETINQLLPFYMERYRSEGKSWSEDIRREILKEYGENLTITAQASLVKGNKPCIGLPSSGMTEPFSVVFGPTNFDIMGGDDLRAEVQPVEGKNQTPLSSNVKLVHTKMPTSNHILVSEELGKKLGIGDGDRIRINDIYLNPSNIDLDTI